MLQPLPNVFLGYFHYEQDDRKLEQVGITHLVNVTCSTEKFQEQSNIFLEKYSLFGQTLDVLVIKLENEIIVQKGTTKKLKHLDIPGEGINLKKIASFNRFLLNALGEESSNILVIDSVSVTLTTALLMTISRMTSSEAVRSIIGPDAENANLTPGLCDQVEADLADWENDVNGLITERLNMTKLSIDKCLEIENFSSKRLEQYYSFIMGDMEDEGLTKNDDNVNYPYIGKLKSKKTHSLKKPISAPKIPSYLKRRNSMPNIKSLEKRKRGGEYSLCVSPKPSYPAHEELCTQPSTPKPSKRYKLPKTPPPKPRKLPRNPSLPRQLPSTPLVVKVSYDRQSQIEISRK